MQRYDVWNDGIHKMKMNFNAQAVIVYSYGRYFLIFSLSLYNNTKEKGQYTCNRFPAEGHLSWLAFVPRNLFDCIQIICGMQ